MATLRFQKAAILGATGPTGIHLAAALRQAGVAVRAVSRREANLQRAFPDGAVETAAADLTRADHAWNAVTGCDLVFDCVGLPPDQMHLHPVVARNVAAALRESGARGLQISSFWAYLPSARLLLDESHPRIDGSAWVRHRREAEDILREAGAAIVNLPDFYGPFVHTSVLQQPLKEAAAGKTMNWIGGLDVPHEYAFVPDAMATAVALAAHAQAYGEHWIIPGGRSITGRQVAELVGRLLRRPVKIRAAGPGLLRVVSWFQRDLRGFLPLLPDYQKPIGYDGGKLRRLIPAPPLTPYDEGIRRTLEWLAAGRAAGPRD